MMLTKNEEDYVKALFYLVMESEDGTAGTNQLADHLDVSPASVNGMLKKLKSKNLVNYEKYGKLQLTHSGKEKAIMMMRKHRLWETFLSKHLNFEWEEVHDVAEQLEHVKSQKLINELDRFLGYPERDPHGDLIPSRDGVFNYEAKISLDEILEGGQCRLIGVRDGSSSLLKYVRDIGLELGSIINVLEIREFDDSLLIQYDNREEAVSHKFASNIFVASE